MAADSHINSLLSNHLSESLSSFGLKPKKHVSMRESSNPSAHTPTLRRSEANVLGTQLNSGSTDSARLPNQGTLAGFEVKQTAHVQGTPVGCSGAEVTGASIEDPSRKQDNPSINSWFDQFEDPVTGSSGQRTDSFTSLPVPAAKSPAASPSFGFFDGGGNVQPTVSIPVPATDPLGDLLGASAKPNLSNIIAGSPSMSSTASDQAKGGTSDPFLDFASSPSDTGRPVQGMDDLVDGLFGLMSSSPGNTSISPQRPVEMRSSANRDSRSCSDPRPINYSSSPRTIGQSGLSAATSATSGANNRGVQIDPFEAFSLGSPQTQHSMNSSPKTSSIPKVYDQAPGFAPSTSPASASPLDPFVGLGDLGSTPLPKMEQGNDASQSVCCPPGSQTPLVDPSLDFFQAFPLAASPPAQTSNVNLFDSTITTPATSAPLPKIDPMDDLFGGLGTPLDTPGSGPTVASATPAGSNLNDLDDIFGFGPSNSAPLPQQSVPDPIASLFNVNTGGFADAVPKPQQSNSEIESLNVSWDVNDTPDIVSDEEGEEGEPEVRKQLRQERLRKKRERVQASLQQKKERDSEEARVQEERALMQDKYGAQIKEWNDRNKGNIRACLGSLETVLWEDNKWKPISMADLISNSQVKRAYFKSLIEVHPDKVRQRGGTVAQLYIADKVFDTLKEAWGVFEATEK
mmetsp:Transcript_24153/g.29280  ORF Transcript_24153/g.29280 Transcript_24153/m.29280 type:complete len:685 (+) Transcript_24153:59-2113(+)|eukprot:CAMPEP_0197845860 /NCGR_PEP_ID=MMETSP1438-20131217/2722_1 /TAXON_ID=1461541 /ORGANISM="Pterosperma sp., Strain CCMP1384" /LENGTH=684 /DNA_ID=CAMNT_0043457309 /DNA_START=44 /DNA_END=2098 /DNA_ORIENTATION=-